MGGVDLMAVAKETEKTEAVIKEDFARKYVETKEVVWMALLKETAEKETVL